MPRKLKAVLLGVVAIGVLLVAVALFDKGTPASDAVKNASPVCADIWTVGKVLPVTDVPCVDPLGNVAFTSYRKADDAIVTYEDPTTKLTRWAGAGTGWVVVEQDKKYGKDYWKDPEYRRALTPGLKVPHSVPTKDTK